MAFDLRLGGQWILLLTSWRVRYGRVVRVSGLEDTSLTGEVLDLVFYCSVEEWKDEWTSVDSSELKSQHWPNVTFLVVRLLRLYAIEDTIGASG